MSINLEKGGRINLSKEAPGLKTSPGLVSDRTPMLQTQAQRLTSMLPCLCWGLRAESPAKNTLFSTTTEDRRTLL